MNTITKKNSFHQLDTNLHFGQFSTVNNRHPKQAPYANSNLYCRWQDLSLSSLHLRSSLSSVGDCRAI